MLYKIEIREDTMSFVPECECEGFDKESMHRCKVASGTTISTSDINQEVLEFLKKQLK